MKRSGLLLLLLPIVSACNDGMQVGSVHVKSGEIIASEGGTLVVTAADNAVLAGTAITIPPASLPSDMVVAIGFSDADLDIEGAAAHGPTIYFAPVGTQLAIPAQLTIPFDEDAEPAKLQVHALVDGTPTDVTDSITNVDAAQRLVSLDLDFLGDLGAHTLFLDPATDGGCAFGACGGPDAGPGVDGGVLGCTFGSCPPGQSCTPIGACADSALCDGVTCDDGEGCDGETGECAAVCGMGGFFTELCEPGEVCDFQTGTCYLP